MNQILKTGRNCWRICDVQECGLLIDASDYYRAFYDAASQAQSYILIAGWQFDSEVQLLRGLEIKNREVRFHPFLRSLCEQNPKLEIYILAWDFSILYALTRDWFQEWIFRWEFGQQIKFRFDAHHPIGASHHQKFAVIDGSLAFVGGMDICASRWDDRQHLADNPDRKNSDQKPYEPCHDIQAYLIGAGARQLTELFKMRWQHAGGGTLNLAQPPKTSIFRINPSMAITAEQVAISRTQPPNSFFFQTAIQEIRTLYLDAINAAEKLIYIENQYFSAQAVYRALVNRMRDPHRSRLQIVIVVPDHIHDFFEEAGMGIAQTRMLRSLKEIAFQSNHALGVYYPGLASEQGNGREASTYIHSKLLLVDDRFLSIGSANIANRSMGLDSELNVSWEAHSGLQRQLIRSIRLARVSLLAEHSGMACARHSRRLALIKGLVAELNRLADSASYRLQRHHLAYPESEWLKSFNCLDRVLIDPEKPIIDENIYELIFSNALFTKGITFLSNWLKGKNMTETPGADDSTEGKLSSNQERSSGQ